jgi:hypothetical protein
MSGAGTQSGLQGAPSRNHPIRGGLDVVEGSLPAEMFIHLFGMP